LVELPAGRYELRVDGDLLKDRSAAEIRSLLSQWQVRDELCRAEGLPVILTEQGVRLVSGN
jgi:hypothetical protein